MTVRPLCPPLAGLVSPAPGARMTRADRAFYALWAASTLARLALAARPQLKYEEAYYWNYSQ
ncbi:MAG TPA: hypothetical protein VNO81_14665, partial [Candidatus Nitrosotenuis sp.]|nr:hypothetical protein [Candidatus Nitrosotenuis sp.]